MTAVINKPKQNLNLKITFQSIRVGDAVLRSPWHLCGGSFRRSLSVILANTIEPLKLTGGKFFILDYTKVIAVRYGCLNRNRQSKFTSIKHFSDR